MIVYAVFLDVEKAFDSIDRNILLDILKQLKFAEKPLAFFANYFYERTQVTRNGEIMSAICEPSLGTPQGTSLSPTLFLIYLNSLLTVSRLKPICFADDITWLGQIDPSNIEEGIKSYNDELKQNTAGTKLTDSVLTHRNLK